MVLNPDKYKFYKKEVKFLDFLVSIQEIQILLEKIQAIQEWPCLCNIRVIQSFLGFANFLKRFIKDYSKLAKPFTQLIRKDQSFEQTKSQEAVFYSLKDKTMKLPILGIFVWKLPIIIETDTSDFAVRGYINQKRKDSRLRPIVYYSKKISFTKLNYDIHDKELLVVVIVFKQQRSYLKSPSSIVYI